MNSVLLMSIAKSYVGFVEFTLYETLIRKGSYIYSHVFILIRLLRVIRTF